MTDETNTRESDTAKFFIYGGLVVHADALHSLTTRIAAIREQHGFAPGDQLKFDTNARPNHIAIATYTSAKNDVIEACYQHKTRFLAYMILHKIVQGGNDVAIQYGMNTILSVFNFKLLEDHNDHGIVVVDRLPFKNGYDYLRGKFTTGLLMEDGRQARLSRIDLFASTCDGASHLSSAVDIVLGAFRYCVNLAGTSTVPPVLFPKVARMLYGKDITGVRHVREYGLTTRPQEIRVAAYQAEYDGAIQRLTALASQVDD